LSNLYEIHVAYNNNNNYNNNNTQYDILSAVIHSMKPYVRVYLGSSEWNSLSFRCPPTHSPSCKLLLWCRILLLFLLLLLLSSTLVCFCLSDWFHCSRPFSGLICSSVLCFSSIFSVLVIP